MSNIFCTGHTFLADGRLISVGGNAALRWLDPTVDDGLDAIRYFDLRALRDGWTETKNTLASNRWYASAQTLPDGKEFVASGSLPPEDNNLGSAVAAYLQRDGPSRVERSDSDDEIRRERSPPPPPAWRRANW